MPKQVWPRKNDAVLEPEVVMYAFIALSALFPATQSRKRGRDTAEPVNLAAYPNVSAFFGTQPGYWVDIASSDEHPPAHQGASASTFACWTELLVRRLQT